LIIYGVNSVREALTFCPGEVEEVLVARDLRGARTEEVMGIASRAGVRVMICDRVAIDRLSGTRSHQGVAARLRDFVYSELDDVLDAKGRVREGGALRRLIVVLDHLEDPQNLGAIIRSAEFFGASGAVIPRARAASITPAVYKASAGATAYFPVARVGNLPSAIDRAKAKGFWVVGADVHAESPIFGGDFTGVDVAVVIGNEARGMGRLVKEKCDFLLTVPRVGRVDSLNAAAAGAIMLYEVSRQWQSKGGSPIGHGR
jgi:23S rRNA (guanosine2251-2'-O)-methyltransferase